MKTITIRDLRQRWPGVEAALELEDEIIITRDSKPVAKLVRMPPHGVERSRWNLEKHRKWIKRVFGTKVLPDGDGRLEAARVDRQLSQRNSSS